MYSARKFISASVLTALAGLSGVQTAHATDIYNGTMSISATDPTQLGRLSRSGVPSDWSESKAFPGVINTTTSYHYSVLDLDLTSLEAGYTYGGYIQITIDSLSATTFLSAYSGSYVATNLATNYLGDAGSSADYFGTDPVTFSLFLPTSGHLELVLNESVTNGGLNMPGNVLVEAFSDTEYTDLAIAAAVPEPETYALMLGGLALLATMQRRRARKQDAAVETAAA